MCLAITNPATSFNVAHSKRYVWLACFDEDIPRLHANKPHTYCIVYIQININPLWDSVELNGLTFLSWVLTVAGMVYYIEEEKNI